MQIFAKAPCRVDMAGGTIDILPLYMFHEGSVTVNFAVDRYASCRLSTRSDRKILLRCRDMGGEEIFDSLDALRKARRYRLPLLAYLGELFAPKTGIELETGSEATGGGGD